MCLFEMQMNVHGLMANHRPNIHMQIAIWHESVHEAWQFSSEIYLTKKQSSNINHAMR